MVDESMLKLFADFLHNPLQPQIFAYFPTASIEGLSSIFRFVIPPQIVGCQVLNACCNYFWWNIYIIHYSYKNVELFSHLSNTAHPLFKNNRLPNCVVDACCNHLWTIYRIAIICHASLRFGP